MMMNFRYFARRYRAELIITGASTLLGIIAPLVIQIWFEDAWLRTTIVLGSTMIFFLIAILFNQKRLFNVRFGQIETILTNYFGLPLQENQFFMRLRHFAAEKRILARILVEKVLPDIVEDICNNHSDITRLTLILDSGTTIAPVFSILMARGIPSKKEIEIKVYSNNLAGIDELHKIDHPESCNLQETNFNLIAGEPLGKYRATTGAETIDYLKTIWGAKEKSKDQNVILSVITANWFLGGGGLETISVCARGRGHLEFKQEVIEHSDYVVLMAPLGKIIRLDDVKKLNDLFPHERFAYGKYTPEKKENTYLLTSYRPKDSLSPLVDQSTRLENVKKNNESNNYLLSEFCPHYDPPGNRLEVEATEIPHEYLRDRIREFFY